MNQAAQRKCDKYKPYKDCNGAGGRSTDKRGGGQDKVFSKLASSISELTKSVK